MYAVQQAGETVHDPRALLYRTARNLVIDQGRRRDVRARHATAQEDRLCDADDTLGPSALEPDTALQSQQGVNAILGTIDSLPPRCRQAFILHKFEGLSHAEVAERMGVSVKMVETHVKNAVLACKRRRDEMHGRPADTPPPLRRRRGPKSE